MPVRLQCPNPDCQASFSILEGEAPRFRRCPKCGWELSGLGTPDPNRPGSADSPQPRLAPGSPAFSGLAPGTTFAGRYEIVRQLGRGGMGAVYLARDTRLDRRVALKLPFFWGGEDPEFLHRFYREARAAAGLGHPNICRVYDVGEHESQPYLTMAYIDGILLSDLKNRSRPMEPAEAIRLVRKLAQVMEVAHQQGIVHRDLKPANIVLDLKLGPIVMDFGLARREGREESLQTRTGQQLGTPAYMPLEQFQGKVEKIGPRSDIYSLGVILFELLTGTRPYEGNAFEIHMKLLRSYPPAPSSVRGGLGTALDWICQKAMAREIADRYASMSQFDQALKGIATNEFGQVSPLVMAHEESPARGGGRQPAPSVVQKSSGATRRPESVEAGPLEEPDSSWAGFVPAWMAAVASAVPVLILGLFLWARSPGGTKSLKPPQAETGSPPAGQAAVVTQPALQASPVVTQPAPRASLKAESLAPPANPAASLQPARRAPPPSPRRRPFHHKSWPRPRRSSPPRNSRRPRERSRAPQRGWSWCGSSRANP